ncbi:MAG: coproporphyrinogen III oxidase, partial [Paracoccaceae bacterium]
MFEVEKNTASEWFSALRDQIIRAFVGLEQSHQSGAGSQTPAGVFEVTETRRRSEDGSDAGGGVMSVLRDGRLFEKVGV